MPRPSKGDRFPVISRLPRAYESKLIRYTEDTGESRTDLTARLLCEFLDHYTPSKNQETLPLRKAS